MVRTLDRSGYTVDTRVSLLEHDADESERATEKLGDRLDGIQRVLVAILISTATASVLLAINVIVQVNGK